MRKLKRSSRNHKGNLPFKFFDYGRIGHFSSKCPFKNKNKNKEEPKP